MNRLSAHTRLALILSGGAEENFFVGRQVGKTHGRRHEAHSTVPRKDPWKRLMTEEKVSCEDVGARLRWS